jgi:hypothetical protein
MTPDRFAFLRRRCDEIRRRGHVRVDEVALLVLWLDEALRAVPVQTSLPLVEAA